MSFNIYAKFLIFWRCPYEDWITPRGDKAKTVKKRVPQRAEIVKIRQFPLQLEQNGKSKIFFFLNCLPMLRNDPSSYGVSLIKTPPQKCNFRAFLPFSTLSRQNLSFHHKSKSTRNNFLPNSVYFYFQISIVKYFLNSKKPCIKCPLLGASTVIDFYLLSLKLLKVNGI